MIWLRMFKIEQSVAALERDVEERRRSGFGPSTSDTSELELGDQEPCAKWVELENNFPMETLEQFEAFEHALRDPQVCILDSSKLNRM